MDNSLLVYGLLGCLAIALLSAAYTDIRRREIDNWLTAGVALGAPLFWLSQGMGFWPGMALQIGLALIVFLVFAAVFAAGGMGGGDVKLIAALALWMPLKPMLFILVAMSLLGAALTLAMLIEHRLRRRTGRPEIPYGVAIAASGLWVIGERFFNQFS